MSLTLEIYVTLLFFEFLYSIVFPSHNVITLNAAWYIIPCILVIGFMIELLLVSIWIDFRSNPTRPHQAIYDCAREKDREKNAQWTMLVSHTSNQKCIANKSNVLLINSVVLSLTSKITHCMAFIAASSSLNVRPMCRQHFIHTNIHNKWIQYTYTTKFRNI